MNTLIDIWKDLTEKERELEREKKKNTWQFNKTSDLIYRWDVNDFFLDTANNREEVLDEFQVYLIHFHILNIEFRTELMMMDIVWFYPIISDGTRFIFLFIGEITKNAQMFIHEIWISSKLVQRQCQIAGLRNNLLRVSFERWSLGDCFDECNWKL